MLDVFAHAIKVRKNGPTTGSFYFEAFRLPPSLLLRKDDERADIIRYRATISSNWIVLASGRKERDER